MITIKTKIERTHRLSIREWRTISKEAWALAGDVWHDEILPKHFTRAGAREYRAAGSRDEYRQRSKRYEARKQKRYGHREPLVFTGDLRRAVTRMRDVRTTGDNSKRRGAVRVVLRGPRYLFAYRKRLNEPDKAAELQVISGRDARLLAKRMDRFLEEELNKTTRASEVRR